MAEVKTKRKKRSLKEVLETEENAPKKNIKKITFKQKLKTLAFEYYLSPGTEDHSYMDAWLKAENDLLKKYKINL